ncbi:MAG TPA: response regulator transcription factor [Burkholderiaceae bacterium]|nr:response regulator transcription factor [Burkholderiaceae bacterium]
MQRRKVLIVDDHTLVLQGLALLLSGQADLEVIALATSSEDALAELAERDIDVAVVDIGLGASCGLALITKIRARWPAVRILVVSAFCETLYAERALRSGAHGYLMKSAAADALLQAVRKVLAGGVYFSARVEEIFCARLSGTPGRNVTDPLAMLSDRQLEVLRLMGEGLGSSQIATAMNLSVKTIESHRGALKAKLGAKSNTELIRIAVAWQQHGPASGNP